MPAEIDPKEIEAVILDGIHIIDRTLANNLDGYRSYENGREQTDAEVLADTDHEVIDNGVYAEMNQMHAWIKRAQAALNLIRSQDKTG